MKTISFRAVLLLLCAMAAGCTNDAIPPVQTGQGGMELAFTAAYGDLPTKTAFQSDGKSIWWSPKDEICIFYGASSGNRFTATNETEVEKAEFRGTLDTFTGTNEGGGFNYFWAVYPYGAAGSCDGESVVATLPSSQTAKAGSFAPNTNIAVAKSPGLALSFYNTCAWFKFSVVKEGIKTVTFRGNNNENIAGTFKVSMGEDGKPTEPVIVDGIKEITLNAPNGESLKVGEWYYITLLPQTFTKGFTATFTTDEETGIRSIESETTYKRSMYNSGENFDEGISYIKDMSGNIPTNEIWYRTKDGKTITIPSGCNFGSNLLSNTYTSGIGILTFESDIKNIPWNVFNKETITEIKLPHTIITIEDGAFSWSSIEYINIPESVEQLGEGMFGHCEKLNHFSGKFASEDGRMLIAENPIHGRTLYAFADPTATSIDISKRGIDVDYVEYGVFWNLPSVETIYWDVPFDDYIFYFSGVKSITFGPHAAGSIDFDLAFPNVEHLVIEKDSNVGLSGWPMNLKSISLENVAPYGGFGPGAFVLPAGCKIYGPNASEDNTCWIVDGNLVLFSFPDPEDPYSTYFYKLPDTVTKISTTISGFSAKYSDRRWSSDGSSFWTNVGVIIPETVTTILSPWCFVMPVIMVSRTPPVVQNDSRGLTSPFIYVQESYISSFQNAWKEYDYEESSPSSIYNIRLIPYYSLSQFKNM